MIAATDPTPLNSGADGTNGVGPTVTMLPPTTAQASPPLPNADAAGLRPVQTPDLPPSATVLTVGTGEEFATLSAAIGASQNGDIILVNAGTYTNDFATITTKITIEGVGGMANLVATEAPPNLKGILTVDNDVTIKNLSFSGAAVPDSDGGNGAGIRYEGGQMVLENDVFSDNQDGILASPVIPSLIVNTISIDHSVFSDNGSGTGYTHNLYIGDVSSLDFTNNITEGAVVGHEFKSRALVNTITGNVFQDGPTGTASYSIDLPNGGDDLIENNTIEKGPDATNDAIIHFGGEGIPYAGSSLTIENNSIVNDLGASAVALLNQTAISAVITGNAFTNIASGQIASGPATGTSNTDNDAPLPDINLVGVLPGNTQIFTDNNPHTVVLSTQGAVEGGGGLLTVIDSAGHVVVIGGAGGLDFTEEGGAGGSSITTKAGSVNALILVGQDEVDSEGMDAITVGANNVTGAIGGAAIIADGTGNDNWSVTGTATIHGNGGSPVVALAASARLAMTGSFGYLEVQDNGGVANVNVAQGGATEAISITSGAADLKVYNAMMAVTTASGPQGAVMHLGAGAAQITSAGADTIYAGSGAETIIVSGAATIHAGTGALALYGRADGAGATLYGNGGDYLLGGDTGNITYYGGALASTLDVQLNNNTLIGGTGRLTIKGGSRETITGGAGGIVYSATDGGGANTITTAAGAQDVLTLAAADVVTSRGKDTIYGGSGNQVITLYGNALVIGSTGNSTLSFYGNDSLVGSGQDVCTVNAGAQVAISAGTNDSVHETDAKVDFGVGHGSSAVALSVAGGAASIYGGTQISVTVDTDQAAATQVTLMQGAASVTLNGADTLQGGSGAATVTILAANTNVTGGSGALTVHDYDPATGHVATIHGGSGTLNYDQGGAALTFIGGSGAAVLNGGWGSLSVRGGSGALTVSGGSEGLDLTAGSGRANISMTSGGGSITFGTGASSVQEAGYGQADIFHFVAGSGGGTDVISGLRAGVDQLVFQGVGIASARTAGGSSTITLTDSTQLRLVGVTDLTDVLGKA